MSRLRSDLGPVLGIGWGGACATETPVRLIVMGSHGVALISVVMTIESRTPLSLAEAGLKVTGKVQEAPNCPVGPAVRVLPKQEASSPRENPIPRVFSEISVILTSTLPALVRVTLVVTWTLTLAEKVGTGSGVTMIDGPEMPPKRVMVCAFGVALSELVKVV